MKKKSEKKLSLEELEARRLYMKNWRKNNPDKIKKHNATFWEKKAQEFKKK